MSSGPDIDAPNGAGVGQSRPSVFDLPTPSPPTDPTPPTLPVTSTRQPEFDRDAEPTPYGRASTPQPSPTFYRTEQDRAKSVYRRANPWYRRLGRGVVALCVLVVIGGALYLGARAFQDYLSRDRLPSAGAELPEIRSSTFIVTSEAPAPAVEGTIRIDASTRAFEFTGDATGPQAGITIVSPDGVDVQLTDDGVTWRPADPGDALVDDLLAIVPYLTDVDGSDDLLGNRLRPYVDLTDQATEGVGSSAIERYEMTVDTEGFSENNPLLWTGFQQQAIPGIDADDAVPLTMWLDDDNVLVRLRALSANWAWERIEYSDQPFAPPAAS